MAEEPDIIYSDTPSLINLTFGKNIFSFYDQNETGLRAGIEVWNDAQTEKIGTFQTPPNSVGYFHFDLQNLLKNYTTPNYSAETYNGDYFKPAYDESYEFKVKYGWVNDAGVFNYQGTYPGTGRTDNCFVLGGRKEYYDLRWTNQSEYKTTIAGLINCPVISSRQQALTDWTIKTPVSKLSGGIPSYISGSSITEVYTLNKRLRDDYLISFITRFEENVSFPAPTGCDGVKGVRLTWYDGDTFVADDVYPNTIADGGGPGSVITTDEDWLYPYNATSFDLSYLLHQVNYDRSTHVYISSATYKGTGSCSNNFGNFHNNPTSEVYRIDFVNDECNDFAPVQVSWLNSFGFRDYFYFSKRTDENISITRNNYEQVEGTWEADRFVVPQYDRGQTTFSQDLSISRTINTKFLSDDEAQYLKNLYISPDVRVRYDGSTEWIPITITDNRWTERTFRKDKFFQYTLNYVEAHKINSQRG